MIFMGKISLYTTTIMIENNIIIFVATLSVGAISGYLGSLLITKRMALVGDALGHVALPGIAVAILYGFSVIEGAFLSLALGILIIWILEQETKLPSEALICILFTVSLASALLVIPEGELEEALIGDLSSITQKEALLVILLSVLVFIIVKIIFKKITLLTLSEDLARAEGIKVNFYKLLYLISIGLTIALGIKFAGSLLVGALLIIPAASSRIVSNSMSGYVYGAMICGVLSVALGILFSNIFSFPAGPITVIISALFFLLAMAKKKIYG